MAKSLQTPESFLDLNFPLAGLDVSAGFGKQPNRPIDGGGYARTTPSGINVRSYEPVTKRARGGQRAGLARYINAAVNSTAFLQDMQPIVGVGYTPPGGTMQTSQSGRVVTLVAVAGGTIKIADAGETSWTTPTGGSGALNSTGVVFSAVNNQKLYFVDGTNFKVYDPATNTVSAWTASAGSLPVDSDSNAPRLIETWRGRTVVSGLLKDSQNWFMSAVGNPRDFDYSPLSTTPTQAVAGNNSQLGLIGDVITALVPFNDDILIFGGDHTLWMMRGDPMSGGQLDLISDAIGMAWGRAWCKDPYGNIYFVSNRTGIYMLTLGQQPQRVSQPIEQLLQAINTGSNTIRLIYDDRFQGLHVFITPTAGAATATHFFWEKRAGAWWQDQFGNNNHNPLCCCTFDGNAPGDRVALIGSWDGYVRFLNPAATDDDGTAITSSVFLGPILTKNLSDVLIKDIQAVLGESSSNVTFEVYVGRTAEAALASSPVVSGTWIAGRNYANLVRRSGYACYLKITGDSPWAMESIRVRLADQGKVRQRGR